MMYGVGTTKDCRKVFVFPWGNLSLAIRRGVVPATVHVFKTQAAAREYGMGLAKESRSLKHARADAAEIRKGNPERGGAFHPLLIRLVGDPDGWAFRIGGNLYKLPQAPPYFKDRHAAVMAAFKRGIDVDSEGGTTYLKPPVRKSIGAISLGDIEVMRKKAGMLTLKSLAKVYDARHTWRKLYTLKDVGPYVDSSRGVYVGEHVQQIAAAHGWRGKQLPSTSEHYHEAWDEATAFMNEQQPVEGAYWGENENGDWGLWTVEENPDGRRSNPVDARGYEGTNAAYYTAERMKKFHALYEIYDDGPGKQGVREKAGRKWPAWRPHTPAEREIFHDPVGLVNYLVNIRHVHLPGESPRKQNPRDTAGGNWWRVRHREPGLFKRGSFRTMVLSPRTQVIRGRLAKSGAWATQSVRVTRSFARTMHEAQAHARDLIKRGLA